MSNGDEEAPEEREEEQQRSYYSRSGLEEAGAGFLQALGDGLGVLLDRSKEELEHVARSGKTQYDLHQAKRERDKLFQRLGREAYQLVEDGELTHEVLQDTLEELTDALHQVSSLEAGPVEPGEMRGVDQEE